MIATLKRHPTALRIGIVAGVVGIAVVLVWFQPQKLFIDKTVDEVLPGSVAQEGGGEVVEQRGSGVTELAGGEFRSLAHAASGRAFMVELEGGERFVRFEDFEVENGPDLRVYLSAAPADSDEGALDEDFIDLGGLKGNVGDQNYAIPDNVDLEEYESVVIWCRRFSVGFAVASLG